MPKKPAIITAYDTYLDIENNGTQGVAECPYCGKEEHFFIDPKSGQHNCKICGASGNLYSFLEDWYTNRLSETTKEDRQELSKLRKGFPTKAFNIVARDGHRWLIPSYNKDGKLSNLRIWIPGGAVHSTASCSLHLIGIEKLKKNGPIYLVEGDWDYFTLTHMLTKIKKNKANVVAAPGCNTFKTFWTEYFEKRDIVVMYDNDGSGSDGMDLVEKRLRGKVNSLQRICWPEALPKKYDVSDHCLTNLKSPKNALKELLSICRPVNIKAAKKKSQKNSESSVEEEEEEIPEKPKKKPNLKKIIAAYKKVLKIGPQEIDAITLIYAVMASVKIMDDPLWLFIVGPPGSGKTVLLNPMGANDLQCITRSRVTPASLVSGFIPDNGNDPSLIPKLMGKCFVLKDWTEIKAMSRTDEEMIYGIMRGAYDGKVEFEYGNDIYRKYEECWFSLVAGVTPVIHGDHRASLGERFLKFEMVGNNYDASEQIRAAMEGIGVKRQKEKELQKVVEEYSHWRVDELNLPKVPKWIYERVLHLSQIIAILRMQVDRTFKGDLSYRPQTEVATRLAKQLIKLAISISIVQEKPITKETYRLVKKVAFDTAIGWGSEVCVLLMKKPKQTQTIHDLEVSARIPHNTLRRNIGDLIQIGAIDVKLIESEGPGRPKKGYLPSEKLKDLWKNAKIDS